MDKRSARAAEAVADIPDGTMLDWKTASMRRSKICVGAVMSRQQRQTEPRRRLYESAWHE